MLYISYSHENIYIFSSSYKHIYSPHYINCIILSVIKTAAHAKAATITRLFSKYAATSAHMNPTKAEIRLAVELNIAGNVIAARHA